MDEDKDKQLLETLLEAACEENGHKRLPCVEAFGLAAKFGVTPAEIGRLCNEQDIHITKCQLGCF